MYSMWGVALLSILALTGARVTPQQQTTKVEAIVDCDMAITKKDCFAGDGCYWCASAIFPAQQSMCVDKMQAASFSRWAYKCTHKKAPTQEEEVLAEEPQSSCDTPRTQDECFANPACVWCQSDFGPAQAHCMDAEQAKYVPKEYITCKAANDTSDDTDKPAAQLAVEAGADPQPGAGCSDANDKKACLNSAACYWCVNKFIPGMGDGCMDESQIKFLPEIAFKCKQGSDPDPDSDSEVVLNVNAPAPAPADPCTDAVDKKTCKDTDGCAWCENQFNPSLGSRCMNAAKAQFIPPSVFKCKAAKKKAALTSTDNKAKVADPCKDAVNATSCQEVDGCAWCENQFKPTKAKCMNATKTHFLPPAVFKCTTGQAATLTKAADPCKDAVNATACQDIDTCVWCENLFDATKAKCVNAAASQFLPPTVFKCSAAEQPTLQAVHKGSDPTPTADPCKDAADKKSCKDIDGCAWCVNQFNPDLGSLCMDAAKSAFIPETVFKCKAAKKTKPAVVAGAAPAPAPTDPCMDAVDKKTCKDTDGCAWCENLFDPTKANCLNAAAAQFLPPTVFKCKASKKTADVVLDVDPTPGPQPGTMCGSSLSKKECLKSAGCYWCTNSFTPASFSTSQCLDEMDAKFLPATMYKCKAAKQQDVEQEKEEVDDNEADIVSVMKDVLATLAKGDGPGSHAPPAPDTPGGGGSTGCTAAMDKKACLDLDDCYWCDNKWTAGMGSLCTDATQAKFLPPTVFKCKAAKHKKGKKDKPAPKFVV